MGGSNNDNGPYKWRQRPGGESEVWVWKSDQSDARSLALEMGEGTTDQGKL